MKKDDLQQTDDDVVVSQESDQGLTGSRKATAATETQDKSEVVASKGEDSASMAEKLAVENAQLTEALQRERADATNIRRRHEEQLAGLKQTLKASIVLDLLPVVDNFERALKHVPEDIEGTDFVKGVQSIVRQFEKTFSDLGVERIKTVGEPFNPNLHEAISMEEGDGSEEIVYEELQAGYRIGDEVVRPAMVRVKS